MESGQAPGGEWPTVRGRLTRARIAGAAADLFAGHGIAGTSVEDIRAAAGASGSQITHYFDGKQGLVRAVIVLHADAAIESIGHFGPAPFRTLADLRSWAGEASAAQAPGCRLGALAGELVRPDPQTQAELAFVFARWTATVRGALEELRNQGGLRPDADPGVLAYSLLASLHGGALIARTARYGMSWHRATDAILACIAPARSEEHPPVLHPSAFASDVRPREPRLWRAALRTVVHRGLVP
jgi:TetR/AcrR family transcriptional regulator, transcriptional repressor for nem operon